MRRPAGGGAEEDNHTSRWAPRHPASGLTNTSPADAEECLQMSREILLLVDALACEKNVSKEIVFGALGLALASATRKSNQEDIDVRVEIDRNTGDYHSFRRWQLVEDNDHEYPSRQVAVSDLDERHAGLELGDFYEEPLEAHRIWPHWRTNRQNG